MQAIDLGTELRQQVSTDGGRTWADIGAMSYLPGGFTLRVVDSTGRLLWIGSATKQNVPCRMCGGSGYVDSFAVKAGPPIFQEKK